LQSEYSLATREMEAEILPLCRELGIAFVAYSPLARALLSGTFDLASLAENDFRRANPRFTDEALAANLARLETLRTIAATHDAKPSQVALAWVLAQGVFAIPGTKRVDYLEQNIAAAALKLTDDELARLDRHYAPGTFTGERYTPEGMKGVNG
ncbi:MAG: aldo/keto reductase, partial [Planctomycetaceae bacterium]